MRMIAGRDCDSAGGACYRNGDIEYAYRQDSHFYYLSGFRAGRGCRAGAGPCPGGISAIVREHDALRESGMVRAGTDGAVDTAPTTPFRSRTSMRSCPD
jgi:hypothetical protein